MKSYETSPLAQQMIQQGMSVEDLWQERFSPLASRSDGNQQVTIVDRYAAANIYNGRNELFNLLKLLHSDSPGCEITLWTSDIASTHRNEIEGRLEDGIAQLQLSGSGIKRITVFLCRDDAFRRSAHARYIRFGDFTCEIGVGIEIFRGESVGIETGFSLKSPEHVQIYRDNENNLRKRQRNSWRWPPRE